MKKHICTAPPDDVIDIDFVPANLPEFEDVIGLFEPFNRTEFQDESVVVGGYVEDGQVVEKWLWVTTSPLQFFCLKTKRNVEAPVRFWHVLPEKTYSGE